MTAKRASSRRDVLTSRAGRRARACPEHLRNPAGMCSILIGRCRSSGQARGWRRRGRLKDDGAGGL